MRKVFCLFIFLFLVQGAFAKKSPKKVVKDDKIYDLTLTADDFIVLPEDENHMVKDGRGVHLFVKKRGDIESLLLLVESNNYNDPDHSLLRAREFNSVNGNEIRYSYGSKSAFRMERLPNALMSSTVEDMFFGQCFHIYIPREMYSGYLIKVQHECVFEEGMTVSIRTFARKYCDLEGKYCDNMMQLNLSDWQTEESFAKIASQSDGKVVHVITPDELTQKLTDEIEGFERSEKTELVFAIDATESMKDDFVVLRKKWLSKFQKQMKKFKDIRIGLVFYKDYEDEYRWNGLPVKNLGFVKNPSAFSKEVKKASVKGGGDWEEAVCEALYACSQGFDWSEDAKKKIILIGDAPPHFGENVKFDMTLNDVCDLISQKGISVDCFLISDSSEKSSNMKTVEKNKAADEIIKAVDTIDAK